MNKPIQEKTTVRTVFVSYPNLVKFENGETVVASIWGSRGLIQIVVPSTQCFFPFRNGKPYIKKENWTDEQKMSFMKK